MAKKLGKKLGAGFLITGSISKLGKHIKIRAKMIDIVTGEILASSSVRVRLDEIEKSLLDDYGEVSRVPLLNRAKNIIPKMLYDKKWLLLLILLVIIPLAYVNRKKITKTKHTKTTKDLMLNDISVTQLIFFEKNEDDEPLNSTNRFAKSTSRHIYFELFLIHPTPGRKIDFTINVIYYSSDGNIYGSTDHDSYIEGDWSTSCHELGWGWEDAGNWDVDDYRIDLFIEGKKIASGSFTIYED